MPEIKKRTLATPSNGNAVSVSALAKAKGLPPDFLRELGVIDRPGYVDILYAGFTGEEIALKRRTAMKAKDGSRWPKGKKLAAYGSWRIGDAAREGRLVLVEGVSDCWALWYAGFPALGLPGAGAAKTIEAEHLSGIDKVYVVQEPGDGGELFIKGVTARLAELDYSGSVFVLAMDDIGHKDPADMRLANPETFTKRFEAVLEGAAPARVPAKPRGIREIDAMDLLTAEDVSPLETLDVLGIDGLALKGGSNLISAFPKVGKTTLLYQCAADWLEQGERIRWLTEEPESIWKDRLTKRQLITQRGLTLVFGFGAGTEKLLEMVRQGDDTVILLDTLRGLGILPEEENLPGVVARAIEPWVKTCRDLGKTLIILHHDNKAGGPHGRGVSGAHSLVGAVDVVLQVHRGKAENQRIITAMGRLGPVPDLRYEQLDDGTLRVVADKEGVEASIKRIAKKKDLVAMLPTEPPGWTVGELVKEAKVTKQDALKALKEACDVGLVVKTGGGRRGDPWTYYRP